MQIQSHARRGPAGTVTHGHKEHRGTLVGDAQLVKPQPACADRGLGAHHRKAFVVGRLRRSEELFRTPRADDSAPVTPRRGAAAAPRTRRFPDPARMWFALPAFPACPTRYGRACPQRFGTACHFSAHGLDPVSRVRRKDHSSRGHPPERPGNDAAARDPLARAVRGGVRLRRPQRPQPACGGASPRSTPHAPVHARPPHPRAHARPPPRPRRRTRSSADTVRAAAGSRISSPDWLATCPTSVRSRRVPLERAPRTTRRAIAPEAR